MPIYEYVCRECGEEFSRIQKMGSDSAGVTCERCGSPDVRRKISSCAVGVGGSGGAGSAPSCSTGGL